MSHQNDEFRGADALHYAENHLRKVRVDPNSWEVEYVNDKTGERWILNYPKSECHGGGIPRLKKINM